MNESLVASELLTPIQLEDFGKTLANRHKICKNTKKNHLLLRLEQNQEIIHNVYSLIHSATRKGNPLSPAAEWLLDNFYLIDEQIRTVRLCLPPKYNSELPQLISGQPRVYDLVREYISHTDAHFDHDSLLNFITAYQETSILKIGELWAVPIMLRLALIENLRHIAEHVAAHYIDQSSAQYWVDRIVKTSMSISNDSILDIAELARSKPHLSSAFVSEFIRGIKASSSNPTLALEWIDQQTVERGISRERHQHRVSQEHAHNQLSISNSIESLRHIDSEDWRDFVELTSMVEQCFRQDPTGIYGEMDFLTRDAYRHVIEYLAHRFRPNHSDDESINKEVLVAEAVLSFAKEKLKGSDISEPDIHFGEYILGDGRIAFEKKLRIRLHGKERLRRLILCNPMKFYFGCQIIVTILLTFWPLKVLYNHFQFSFASGIHLDEIAFWFIFSLAIVIGSTTAAASVINWLSTLIVKPKVCPRFDFTKGVPKNCRTLVAIPSMLTSLEKVQKLVDDIEIRYLGNQDNNIAFALLTDFTDAPIENLPDDQALVMAAQLGIDSLNQKYRRPSKLDPFYLLHRPRRWNLNEGVWMGYERKRGKLADLNRYLRGGAIDCFMCVVGDKRGLEDVRYVITLDEDTILPRESAIQLIATIAHPLNKAQIDPMSGDVRRGYGILQPRVSTQHQREGASFLMRLASDDGGIDPYTKAVSDVYQDIFHEGSFIGKGIYDVDAFQASTGNRFPENRILSHDLIEGCVARCGFINDIQIIEEFPSTYISDARRRHRWMRGDWQIAAWLMPKVLDGKGQSVPNSLSILSLWKVFDNLRRSVMPITMFMLLILSWLSSLRISYTISAVVIAYMILPYCLVTISVKRRSSTSVPFLSDLYELTRKTLEGFIMAGLSLAFLPFEAFLAVDAGVRSCYRLLYSKKNLLEWCTTSDSQKNSAMGTLGYFRFMWVAPFFGGISLVAIFTGIYAWNIFIFIVATMWIMAPFIAWLISRPLNTKETQLSDEQNQYLAIIARRTWHYFETFVTANDHWLPPDNYQEFPRPILAHRTSPTNIGLGLLSTLGAYDFGYITLAKLIERVEGTIQTLEKLPRFKGHFYNWYDTLTLEPLQPLYVSTVDSGNLAASFIILEQGLLELADVSQSWSAHFLDGLNDTFLVFKDSLEKNDISLPSTSPIFLLERKLKSLDSRGIAGNMKNAEELHVILEQISTSMINIKKSVSLSSDSSQWFNILFTQMEMQRLDLRESTDKTKIAFSQNKLWELAKRAAMLTNQDYEFIYNHSNKLMSIGYHVYDAKPDNSHYDLLASEARLASFLAVAIGNLPQEHWFALGRQLTTFNGVSTLLSWSGSMFEYLMPNLFLPSYRGSLLDHACKQAVICQRNYGRDNGVPWGISESGYNMMDAQSNYQYRAFGVPGLGFKRDLDLDLVITPYATVMALMVDPLSSIINLKEMASRGYQGEFGFYEAIDFTANRLPSNVDSIVIKSYMTHHHGMSFLSLASVLLDKPMQRRMQNDPRVKATELLLYEKVPRQRAAFSHVLIDSEISAPSAEKGVVNRVIRDPNQMIPDAHLLGNGSFHTLITSAGGGYSKWKNICLTRWREDGTTDALGAFIYVREPATNKSWSVTYQPTLVEPDSYEAIFSEGRAEFRRVDHDIEIYVEIAVSPDFDAEVRQVKIKNLSHLVREIEITTYAEVVLSSLAADIAHPAFNKLFVETEILPELSGILCHRRKQSMDDENPWLCHAAVAFNVLEHKTSFETDRAAFIGRNHDLKSPTAVVGDLSGTFGAVLDPIVAVRQTIKIQAGATATINCMLGVAKDRNTAIQLLEQIQEKGFGERTMELASAHDYMMLRQINSNSREATLFGELLSPLIYGATSFRTLPNILKSNVRSQSNLWGYGISGDLPIVLIRINDKENLELVRQILRAHAYWHHKGMAVDLMIWNEDNSGYRQDLQNAILQAISFTESAKFLNNQGCVFLRSPNQMPEEDRILFQTVARINFSDAAGSLELQAKSKRKIQTHNRKRLLPNAINRKEEVDRISDEGVELSHANRFGGFSPNGKEYIINVKVGNPTPAPWVNVISNPNFGTLVTESGAAFTWFENAREYRLTPWSNDPITDPSGECLYLKDEIAGDIWSATPMPTPGNSGYTVTHGYGYTKFQTSTYGIDSELTQFVAHDSPVKFFLLKISNRSSKARKISATLFLELVLGDDRSKTKDFIVTESDLTDMSDRLMLAKNVYSTDFSNKNIFLSSTHQINSLTGDRLEFLGRNGSVARPAALENITLSGKVGALLDPCMAMQVAIELAPNESEELAFVFGCADSVNEARLLSKRFHASTHRVYAALEAVENHWLKILTDVQIETPDTALNILGNGWLLYQTISSRIWGRTSFYQPGGAYGFRDQLQDIMAVLYAAPVIAKEHILRCAKHQFVEGDVQHWWHPPTDKGVRTRFSDDYLWLPYVTSQYIRITGDYSILDLQLPFIEARELLDGEESNYGLPSVAEGEVSVFEHCVRALRRSFTFGKNGLPLIGSGDWNDGMNLVGIHGKGESVWLGFFLYETLKRFKHLAEHRSDDVIAQECEKWSEAVKNNIEAHAWDGSWYTRAFFDDGTPLGVAGNSECSIDSIVQSWAVISGAGARDRAKLAMDSVYRELVREKDGLVLLFHPPFDKAEPNPGYIAGYLPGVRENGGQYTHAALWAAIAFAEIGENDRAMHLLKLLDPIRRGASNHLVDIYKVEPYVVAADVYNNPSHIGRGGWTWYTGSAALYYRAIMETFLGFDLRGDRLNLSPRVPKDWQEFKIQFKYKSSSYQLIAQRLKAGGLNQIIEVDDIRLTENSIQLYDDGKVHQIRVQFSDKGS